tara:strand:- start:134 stop:517 length:384 start_codon:yes stop_codon:yes gene_type:complete
MIHVLTAAVYGALIAAFASHTPPPMVKRPFQLHTNHPSRYEVWIAPTRNSYSILAYTNRDDSIHYFKYTFDSVLVQSMWAPIRMTIPERIMVFTEVAEWYTNVSNNVLTSNMTNLEDVAAWNLAFTD